MRLSAISSFFTADLNAHFTQHIKKLDLIRLNSALKFLHGRVLWKILNGNFEISRFQRRLKIRYKVPQAISND